MHFQLQGVLIQESIYPGLSACEVGWPVAFLSAYISTAFTIFTVMWKVIEHSAKAWSCSCYATLVIR